nr:hypothetical protein [Limosilactobacillus mucosae]
MKKMELKTTDTQFKIDDTSTTLHYTAWIDGVRQQFTNADSLRFYVKQNETFLMTVKAGLADNGFTATLQSKDLSALPVGNYELELWDVKDGATVGIYPDNGFLAFAINENALGTTTGNTVSTITLESMQQQVNQLETDFKARFWQLKGDPGDPGATPTFKIGTVTQGSQAAVTDSGSGTAHVLNFTVPVGQAATVTVGTVTALPADSKPTVTMSGTEQNRVLNFGIPTPASTQNIGTDKLSSHTGVGAYFIGKGASDSPTANAYTVHNMPTTTGGIQYLYDAVDGTPYVRTWTGTTFTAWTEATMFWH